MCFVSTCTHPSTYIYIILVSDLNDLHGVESPWGIANLSAEQKATLYRWLVFIPANIYPTITVIEFPERFISIPSDPSVRPEEAHEWVKNGTKKKQEEVWKLLEENLGSSRLRGNGTFLLGTSQPTILDLLVTLVAHWGPRSDDDIQSG